MIDLLTLLHLGELSLDEAYQMLDEAVGKFHSGEINSEWWEWLQLSKYEVTARVYGASLMALAKLRFDGWPNICSMCDLPLDYRLFGWSFVVGDENTTPKLRHIECPSIPPSY